MTSKDDPVACRAGLEGSKQFAAAGHVEASATVRHQSRYMDVGIGFDAVTEKRLDRRESLLQLAQVMEESFLAIHEQWSAVFLG